VRQRETLRGRREDQLKPFTAVIGVGGDKGGGGRIVMIAKERRYWEGQTPPSAGGTAHGSTKKERNLRGVCATWGEASGSKRRSYAKRRPIERWSAETQWNKCHSGKEDKSHIYSGVLGKLEKRERLEEKEGEKKGSESVGHKGGVVRAKTLFPVGRYFEGTSGG